MNAQVPAQRAPISNLPALQMDEQELMGVLRNSLYPGAADGSIKMALAYCRASGLDVMQKPVHIVPMWDKASGTMRDVIMPGVGLYRTQAARSGQFGGITEPEFGPDVTEAIGGQQITYPAWCRVTVKRLLTGGHVAEFTASERWKENYAVRGGKEKSIAPNAMWTKRPYGQLAKCAQAQALRMAFPEMVGAAPTADEMEGKALHEEDGALIDGQTGEVIKKATPPPADKPAYPDTSLDKNHDAWLAAIQDGKKTPDDIIAMVESRYTLTDDQRATIRGLAAEVQA